MNKPRYFSRFIPTDDNVFESKYVLYGDELFRNIPNQSKYHNSILGSSVTNRSLIKKRSKKRPLKLSNDKIHLPVGGNLKAAKLFLCSADIKKGDKFYHTHLNLEYDCVDVKEDGSPQFWGAIGNLSSFPPSDYLVKKLGVIDSAGWVQEGDEFTEGDVAFIYRHQSSPENDFISPAPCDNYPEIDQFKCFILVRRSTDNIFC